MEKIEQTIIDHKSGVSKNIPLQAPSNVESKSFIQECSKKGRLNPKDEHSEMVCLNGAFLNGRMVGTKEGEPIIVDGKAYVSGTIPGIESIKLETKAGIFYDYTVVVKGACPKGYWDNKLQFTDESGDTYTLRIFSTSLKEHTVNYHSSAGALIKITWDI
jgi:hypothetical protein